MEGQIDSRIFENIAGGTSSASVRAGAIVLTLETPYLADTIESSALAVCQSCEFSCGWPSAFPSKGTVEMVLGSDIPPENIQTACPILRALIKQ